MATIIISGRLTADVLKKERGNNLYQFTLAEDKRQKTEGEEKNTANFYYCTGQFSDKQAEYLTKGKAVEIVGEFNIHLNEKDNVKYYNATVFVYNLTFVSTPRKKEEKEAEK